MWKTVGASNRICPQARTELTMTVAFVAFVRLVYIAVRVCCVYLAGIAAIIPVLCDEAAHIQQLLLIESAC